jgi:hypothetical protein
MFWRVGAPPDRQGACEHPLRLGSRPGALVSLGMTRSKVGRANTTPGLNHKLRGRFKTQVLLSRITVRADAPTAWLQRRVRVCNGAEEVGGGTDRVGQWVTGASTTAWRARAGP